MVLCLKKKAGSRVLISLWWTGACLTQLWVWLWLWQVLQRERARRSSQDARHWRGEGNAAHHIRDTKVPGAGGSRYVVVFVLLARRCLIILLYKAWHLILCWPLHLFWRRPQGPRGDTSAGGQGGLDSEEQWCRCGLGIAGLKGDLPLLFFLRDRESLPLCSTIKLLFEKGTVLWEIILTGTLARYIFWKSLTGEYWVWQC